MAGATRLLDLPALSLVSSRLDSTYGDTVAAAACAAARRAGAALWVRASRSGAERAALRSAAAEGVPVVLWCAAPAQDLPAGLFEGRDPAATAVASTAPSRGDAAVLRDRACGELPAIVVPAEASRDVAAVLGHAVRAGTPLAVLHPPRWRPAGPTALLHQALAGTGRVDRLGWPLEVVEALERRDVPANAVCENPAGLAVAVQLLMAFERRVAAD